MVDDVAYSEEVHERAPRMGFWFQALAPELAPELALVLLQGPSVVGTSSAAVGVVAFERNFASYFASLTFALGLEFEVCFPSVGRRHPSRTKNPLFTSVVFVVESGSGRGESCF